MAYEKEVPNWQETGSDIPESKLTEGWKESERPPANWFNRFFHSVAQAISELQTKSAETTYVDEYMEAMNEQKMNRTDVVYDTGESTTLVMSQKGVTDALEELRSSVSADDKIDITSITNETGISATLVMSQKGVTDALSTKVDKSSIVSEKGTNSSFIASQKLVTTLIDEQAMEMQAGLDLKIDKSAIVSTTGTSSDTVMSQKGVTEAISSKVDKSIIEHSVSNSSEKIPSSSAVQNYVEKNVPRISYGTVLPSSGNEGDIFILY